MLLENVEKYIIWLFFYSVVGWIYESTLCSVRAHKFINRGFLNGPYCPIYGWGAVLDILILGKVQNPVLLFFLGAIVTCSLEYFTSYIMEKLPANAESKSLFFCQKIDCDGEEGGSFCKKSLQDVVEPTNKAEANIIFITLFIAFYF